MIGVTKLIRFMISLKLFCPLLKQLEHGAAFIYKDTDIILGCPINMALPIALKEESGSSCNA